MKRKGVLCFIKKDNKVLLILVDYADKLVWNGVSGYIEPDESNEDAIVREVKEEIDVTIDKASLVYKGEKVVSENLELEVYTATKWEGILEPKEESIKRVEWFKIDNLPFEKMNKGNEEWITELIK